MNSRGGADTSFRMSSQMESNPLHPQVIPLLGTTTHYAWGCRGPDSEAARMHSFNRFSALDPNKPCSEFLISTHPAHSGAVLATTPSVPLRDHVHSLVIEVEPSMVDFYSGLHSHGLPYILKIVSVSKPQSVHVHPDDAMVGKLQEDRPEPLIDQVGKAVMMIAIDDVEMLFGFQSAQDIVGELSRVPEFADAVGRPQTDHFVHLVKTSTAKPSDIRQVVTNLLERKRDFIRKCLEATTERFLKMPEDALTENDRQLISFHKLYPDDVMCFAVYLLNRVKLQEGMAVFIHPQEPCAVLSGNFVEASTCSDFTISAGLTDQGVQTKEFLDCLSYDDSPVEVSSGERFSEYGVSYVPPVPQFQLLSFTLPRGISQPMVETIAPSIVLVLDGEGSIKTDGKEFLMPMRAGSVYYLSAQCAFVVTALGKEGSVLHFVQIGVNESWAPSSSSSCVVM